MLLKNLMLFFFEILCWLYAWRTIFKNIEGITFESRFCSQLLLLLLERFRFFNLQLPMILNVFQQSLAVLILIQGVDLLISLEFGKLFYWHFYRWLLKQVPLRWSEFWNLFALNHPFQLCFHHILYDSSCRPHSF